MRELSNLAQCLEIRQVLAARPPRVVHGTVWLMIALVGTGLTWAAVTSVDQVIRGRGRVRPDGGSMKSLAGPGGQPVVAAVNGRVLEVRVREGDSLRAGEVMVRLDTQRRDHEIAKLTLTIEAQKREIAALEHMRRLLEQQASEAQSKAEADVGQADGEIQAERERRAADVRLARLDVRSARDEEGRTEALVREGIVARVDAAQAASRRREAEERLRKASIEVEPRRLEAARRALEMTKREYALKVQDLEIRLEGRRTEVDSAAQVLAPLVAEREQALVRAPTDGIVTALEAHVGDVVEAGRTLARIASGSDRVLDIAVSNSDIGDLRVGMSARVKLDAYDYQKYGTLPGSVVAIAPDSEVLDGGVGPTYFTVRIALSGTSRAPPKLGMTGTAEILTGKDRLLFLAFRKLSRKLEIR